MIIPAPAILRLVAATLIPAALLYAVTPQFRPLLLFGIFRRMRMDISNLHFVYIDLDLEGL